MPTSARPRGRRQSREHLPKPVPIRDTGVVLIVWLLVVAAICLPLPVLTALGAHRRGGAVPLAVLAGLFFPVAWTVWYLRDDHPYRRAQRHVA